MTINLLVLCRREQAEEIEKYAMHNTNSTHTHAISFLPKIFLWLKKMGACARSRRIVWIRNSKQDTMLISTHAQIIQYASASSANTDPFMDKWAREKIQWIKPKDAFTFPSV